MDYTITERSWDFYFPLETQQNICTDAKSMSWKYLLLLKNVVRLPLGTGRTENRL